MSEETPKKDEQKLKLNIITPSFTLMPPGMDLTEKVAAMARICYKSEAKADPENNMRLIRSCVGRGHTSVIEHGFVSVWFSPATVEPTEFSDAHAFKVPFSAATIWSLIDSPDKRKYIDEYIDSTVYKSIDGEDAPPRAYPVAIGNFRAWSNVLLQCFGGALQNGSILALGIVAGIVVQAKNKYEAVFEKLYTDLNNALKLVEKDARLHRIVKPDNEESLCLEDFEKYYSKLKVVVTDGSPSYSLSVIMRTDRSVTHQLVRHRRDVAYSQESQRYVAYDDTMEFVRPLVDPVRYAGMTFDSAKPDEKPYPLMEGGFVDARTKAFQIWLEDIQIAAGAYNQLRGCKIHPAENAENGTKDIPAPPEFARNVLPNSTATTIGVTWTPVTFLNVVHWRLDKHAQWPIRSMIGRIIAFGLMNHHPFFDNYPTEILIGWLTAIKEQQIWEKPKEIDVLIEAQKDRQRKLDEFLKARAEKIAAARKAAQEEAFKKNRELLEKEKKEAEAKKEQEAAASAATPAPAPEQPAETLDGEAPIPGAQK